MKLVGYADFDWGSFGFAVSLPLNWNPFPSIDPVVLTRTGAFPTFGPSEIGELTIPATVTLTPECVIGDPGSRIEDAFLYFFKRLNPYKDEARQLRAQRNNGTLISIPAKIRLNAISDNRNVNQRLVDFVSVQGCWDALSPVVASGTF